MMLRRVFEYNKKPRWIDSLPKLIDRYNASEHRTQLGNMIPTKELERISKLKELPPIVIDTQRLPPTGIKVGDTVRLRIMTQGFDKKTLSPSWSSEVYSVRKIAQDKIELDNGATVLASELKLAKPLMIHSKEHAQEQLDAVAETQKAKKNRKTVLLQQRSGIKPGHEILDVKPNGEVVFKKRLQPANKKRQPKVRLAD